MVRRASCRAQSTGRGAARTVAAHGQDKGQRKRRGQTRKPRRELERNHSYKCQKEEERFLSDTSRSRRHSRRDAMASRWLFSPKRNCNPRRSANAHARCSPSLIYWHPHIWRLIYGEQLRDTCNFTANSTIAPLCFDTHNCQKQHWSCYALNFPLRSMSRNFETGSSHFETPVKGCWVRGPILQVSAIDRSTIF